MNAEKLIRYSEPLVHSVTTSCYQISYMTSSFGGEFSFLKSFQIAKYAVIVFIVIYLTYRIIVEPFVKFHDYPSIFMESRG